MLQKEQTVKNIKMNAHDIIYHKMISILIFLFFEAFIFFQSLVSKIKLFKVLFHRKFDFIKYHKNFIYWNLEKKTQRGLTESIGVAKHAISLV